MGFRMRKSMKIAPGVRLNVTKRGVVGLGVALTLLALNVEAPASGQSSRLRTCPSVRGGALSQTTVRNTTCAMAQRLWNHFSWVGARRPPLPKQWKCYGLLIANERSETTCVHTPPASSGLYTVWARFIET
jgi:hypothetical protein